MKKAKIIGKKTLSVFLAVLMVLTAWVWVAPTEVSAAAGKYDVMIKWYVESGGDMNGNGGTIKLTTKSDNGTGSTTTHSAISFVNADTKTESAWSTTEMIWTNVGFPYSFTMALTNTTLTRTLTATVHAYVRKTGTSTWSSSVGSYKTDEWEDNTTNTGVFTISNKPTPTTLNWSGVTNLYCPSTGDIRQTVSVTAYDQFSVQMYDPSWSIKGSVCGQSGIALTTYGAASGTTIILSNGASVAGSTNKQTGTITATWETGSKSKTFDIYDSNYTAQFGYMTQKENFEGEYTIENKDGYYGDDLVAPEPPAISIGDKDYEFSHWEPEVPTQILDDVTYRAQYTASDVIKADYSKVDSAISEVDDIKELYGADYEFKYTNKSLIALENAINAVVFDLGRTQQARVDYYAQSINNAIVALEPNTFNVIFLDKNGAILKYEKNAEYKSTVAAPAFPEDQKSYYDAEKHYTYDGWDTDEYTSVIDDLVISPVYTAEAHDWKIETVTSTCVQAGTQKYTCKVCGYVKYDGGDQLGDHVWEDDFTVDLEPTCVLTGSKSIHCSLCDAQKDVTSIPAKGHSWEDFTVAISPTCDRIGISTRVCAEPDCRFCEHLMIDPLGHDYTKTTVSATCTTKGYDEYTCQRDGCGHSYRDNYTDVIDHVYTTEEVIQEKACDVTEIIKYTCECGYIKVESGETGSHDALDSLEWEVLLEDTCTTKGYRTKTCSKCDNVIQAEVFDEITKHDTKTETTAATCSTAGYIVETCQRNGCDYEKTTVIQPLGHDWHEGKTTAATCTSGGYITYTCQRTGCGETKVSIINGSNALLHDFDETIAENVTIKTPETCTADGEKTVKCSRCDATTTVIIPRLGHNYGAWDKTTNPATNNEDGTWTRKCNNCGDVETLTIPKGDHNLVEDKNQYIAPQCNSEGQQVYKCTNHDNCPITVTVKLGYAEHTVTQKVTDATCTAPGSVVAYCSVCNTPFKTTETPVKAHSFVAQEAVAPTCENSGYTPYKCSVCGFTYNVYEGADPLGHTYEITTTAATCTTEGEKIFTCDCGKSYTEIIPATGHKYVENADSATTATCAYPATKTYNCDYKDCNASYVAVVAPKTEDHTWGGWKIVNEATNTSNGYETNTCSTCGKVEGKIIPATGAHVFDKATGNKQDANCTAEGWVEYKCSTHDDCGLTWKDVIPAEGHTQEITYSAPTCFAEGSSKVVCSKCNAEILNFTVPATGIHDFSGEGVKSDSTCADEGTMTYTCKTEGCNKTKIEIIPAKGHDLTTTVADAKCGEKGSVITTCSRCDYKSKTELAAKGHIWKDTYESKVDATCEKDGSETYKCQNCDKTNVVVLPKLGHNWGKWTVVPSKNGEVGSVSRTCSRGCTESVEIPAGNHHLTETARTNSTCVKPGSVTYTCQVAHENGACGISVTVELPLAEHTIVTYEEVATCTKDGYIKTYCSVNGCTYVASNKVTKKIAHVFEPQTAVAPTCTTSGYTPYECKSCTESYNVYDATKPATGHTYVGKVTTASTCTTEGEKTFTCSCGKSYTETIPATGHSHVKGTVTAANCTTAGTEVYKCACGDTYTKLIEAAKGHTFGGWTVTQAATADQYGIQERTCSACNTVEIGKVAPIGNHTFVEKIEKEATCTDKGEKSFTCSAHENCSANYTEEIPAKGHTQKIDYKAPTCVANGYSKIVCSVESCKAEIMSAEILATGIHDFNGEAVKADATCTAEGSITYTCKTNGCNATKVEKYPAKGHNYVSVVTEAKCETAGEVVTTCSSCGDSTTKTLDALNHKWNEGEFEEGDAPTCTSTGTKTYTCTVAGCGKTKTETIEMLDHTWGDWKVTPSTNSGKGSVSRICSVCKVPETIEIPAGGHNLVVDKVNSTDATCTGEGTLVYKCENHTNCGITVSVIVPMIQHTLTTTKKDATCTAAGEVVTKCSKCNTETHTTSIPAKGHTVKVTTTPATCIEKGSVVEGCDNCDYKVTTTLPMIPHDYSGEEINKVDATCIADGSKDIKCTTEDCTATTHVVIPKLGHSWSGWVKKEATNDTDGSWSRECTRKDCNVKENLPIPAGGHELVEDTSKYVASTCNTKGKRVYVCNNKAHENCSVTVTVELDFGPHTIAQKLTEATCEVEGKVEAYCSVCDTECKKPFNTTVIPVKAHVFEAQTPVDATCTTSGYTPYKCKSCTESYNVYDDKQPATGHTLIEGASDATCEKGGAMILECENCNYSTTVNVPALGHKYKKTDSKSATCAAAATETYICEHANCNSTYTISVGEKSTTHTWGAWTVKESATATSLGYEIRTCETCGQIEVQKIPATGEHNFSKEIDRKNATCTEPGWIKYDCSTHADENDCKLTSTVALPAIGHTEKHEYKAATCTDTGYSRMYCETCKVDLSKEIIPELGHNWNSGVITNATCETEGKIVRTCSRGCTVTDVTTIPVNPNAHQYATEVVKATCTSAGSVVTKCVLCDNVTTNETLAQLQHTWDNGNETKAATCLGVGIKTYKCNDCTATKTEDITALGHSWGEWTETKASTNSEKGILTRTCSRGCTETAEIPAGGHRFEKAPVINNTASCIAVGSATYKCSAHENCGVEVDVVLPMLQHELEKSEQAATCDTDGFVTVKCKNCESATYTTVIPATGHTFNDGEKTPATCTATGKIIYTCTAMDCGKTKEVILDMLQHNYKAGTPVEATCTSNGYTPYKCETCASSYVILDAAAPAKGHTFNTVVSSTANCTEGGVMTLKCACGKTMETQVSALGHDYQFSVATMATCAEAATETFKCSRCADSYTVSVGSKTNNHDWNDWVIVKATNTSLGYKTRTCKACDKLELEIIPATGEHNFSILDTDNSYGATCVKDGLEVYKCSTHENCAETSSVVIPAKGHTEQLSYNAASCSEAGYTKITCAVVGCNYEANKIVIPALDHAFEVESIKNATCKTEGTIILGCKNCDETKSQAIAVDETAHQLKTTVNLATYEKAGSVIVTCKNNGCTYKEETPIPMLKHDWSSWEKVDSTNSKPGSWTSKCSSCGEVKSLEIPKGGHEFGDTPDSTTSASCTAEGTATYNCTAHTNCGVTITVKTGKLQHTLVTDSKDSSCTESGYVKVYCSECKASYTNMTIGKLAHEFEAIKEVAPTCTSSGYTTYKCKNCTETYDQIGANPVPHKYEKEGAMVTVAPTCTEMGYTTYTCDVCKTAFSTAFVKPNGHNFNETIAENVTTVAATCETDGSKTVKCAACDEKTTAVIPKLGHNYIAQDPVAPTCTEKGYTVYKCDNSGCNSAYSSDFVNASGHIDTTTERKESTCSEAGYEKVICKCGYVVSEKKFALADHDYEVTYENGVFTYTCKVGGCGFSYTEADTRTYKVRFFDATGEQIGETQEIASGKSATVPADPAKASDGNYHYIFSGWDRSYDVITSDIDIYPTYEKEAHTGGTATCNTKAECEKCGEPYGKVDASMHTLDIKVEPASCEKDGKLTYYCTNKNCDYERPETIVAPGHNYGNWEVYQNGNCSTPFIKIRKCQNYGCDAYEQTETYGAHTWYTQPEVAPTCTTEGHSAYKYCTTCGVEIDSVVIPKLPHRDNNGDGKCDYCTFTQTIPSSCKCMCHNTGFMKFIYAIVRFFWKLSGSSPICACGINHY